MSGSFCSVVPTDVGSHASALFEAFSADTPGANWTYLPYGPFATADALRGWMQTTCAGLSPRKRPAAQRAFGGSSLTRRSPKKISPLLGSSKPAIMLPSEGG